MKRSDNITDLAAALAKAQAMMRPATKDAVNPHFKSKYADLASVLEAIREPFAANGLALTQHPTSDGERVEVQTILLHSSGQWLESSLAMTPQQRTPQSVGSAITYARRYAAMAVAGLAADDDDGEGASHGHTRSTPAPEAPRHVEKQAPVSIDGAYTDKQKHILLGLCKMAGLSGGEFFKLHEQLVTKGVPISALQAEIKKYKDAL